MEFIPRKVYSKRVKKDIGKWKSKFKTLCERKEKKIEKYINPIDIEIENMWERLPEILK